MQWKTKKAAVAHQSVTNFLGYGKWQLETCFAMKANPLQSYFEDSCNSSQLLTEDSLD